jgi:hypothetical protein
MITSLLASYPWLAPVGLVIWELIEIWLGVLKPMDAGSIPQLMWNFILHLKRKGAQHMANNPNARALSVTVDGPTYDALGVLVTVVEKLAAGEKPQAVATEEIGQAMALMTELPQITGDYVLDRLSVENAVGLQMASLVDAIMTIRASKLPK